MHTDECKIRTFCPCLNFARAALGRARVLVIVLEIDRAIVRVRDLDLGLDNVPVIVLVIGPVLGIVIL